MKEIIKYLEDFLSGTSNNLVAIASIFLVGSITYLIQMKYYKKQKRDYLMTEVLRLIREGVHQVYKEENYILFAKITASIIKIDLKLLKIKLDDSYSILEELFKEDSISMSQSDIKEGFRKMFNAFEKQCY